jgi:hypothetical protein
MKEYEIYFSIFGKHLKTTVYAESEEDAYEAIRNKIVFHKDKTKVGDDPVEHLKNIFGFK